MGSLLTIQGRTPAIKRFYDELSPCLGHPSERDSLHLTLVDSCDTVVDVFSDRDLIALRRTQDSIAHHLGSLPLSEITLRAQSRLEKMGRHLVALVEPSPVIEDTRGALEEIIKRELGESLSSRDYIPHVSMLSLYSRGSRRPPSKPAAPANLHVNGFFVGQLVFRPSGRRPNKSLAYVNRPRDQVQG